ncbi:MAG: hypothetical protein U1E77_00520 [Inhella sp.]
MKFYKLPIIAVSVLLSACAAGYRAPTGSEVARLRIVGPQVEWRNGINAIGYPSGKCEDPMELAFFGGIKVAFEAEKPLGIPGADGLNKHSFIERLVPAGSEYLVSVRSLSHTGSCVVTFSFTPQAGMDYEAQMRWDNRQCFVGLQQLALRDGSIEYSRDATAKQVPTCRKGLN